MRPLSLHDALAALATDKSPPIHPAGADRNAMLSLITHDTRDVAPNTCFVALKGERVDGHDLLPEAHAAGATVAIVDRINHHIARECPGLVQVRVPSPRAALAKIAAVVRDAFVGLNVVAVTGSNGKTGTKHFIGSVLAQRYRGTISPKSFNNDIGVPVTLFAANQVDDYVVVEIGTNQPGEVAALSQIARPNIAVITSIGQEHLEFFHDLDGVRLENASIADHLSPGGLLVANGDDEKLLERLCSVGGHARRIITFGLHERNDLCATDVRVTLRETTFSLDGKPFVIPTPGRHHASNALAAVAVGREMKLTDEQIAIGLSTAHMPAMRTQPVVRGSVTFINDAYNANPTSMLAAIATIDETAWPGRKIAILGGMAELGESSAGAHQDVVEAIEHSSVDLAILVGPAFSSVGRQPKMCRLMTDVTSASAALTAECRGGELVLVKGSRSSAMERVIESFAKS